MSVKYKVGPIVVNQKCIHKNVKKNHDLFKHCTLKVCVLEFSIISFFTLRYFKSKEFDGFK